MAAGAHRKTRSKKSIPETLNPMGSSSRKPQSSLSRRCSDGVCSVRAALLAVLVLLALTVAWSFVSSDSGPATEFYGFEIVNEFDHDPKAFTQGLLYAGNDTLFESTGLYKESTVREVALQSGKVKALHKMEGSFFGEGLTLLGKRLFQVTWLTRTGFIYDRYNLHTLGTFTHQMKDGWGLATDGKNLFGSDGTSSLYEISPHNFKVINRVTVRYQGHEVPYLNELEYINGEVWANVWQSDCIARISHKDGKVLSWVLLHPLREHLLASGHNGIDVLNGIAWAEDKKRLFVTGKWWPKIYEIRLRPIRSQVRGHIRNVCRLM